jgi:multiple antibiotic resistance protein
VIDIAGSIPIIIDLRKKVGRIQSEKATLVSLVIMVGFLFLGEQILSLIGIDVSSFAVAGSFILFFLSLEMILGISIYKHDDSAPDAASVVPLAFPLIAGAGSLTSILALRAEFATINIIIAIVVNLLFVYAVLKFSTLIERLIGKSGIDVVRKIFGVVLLAIAVKLFTTNIQGLF